MPYTCPNPGRTSSNSISTLLTRLAKPETRVLSTNIIISDGIPLGGAVELTLSSNGNYTFKGHMRATGFPSYHFGLQVFIKAADGVIIAAFHSGRVFGTDTPGDRENSWEENLNPPFIKRSLAFHPL